MASRPAHRSPRLLLVVPLAVLTPILVLGAVLVLLDRERPPAPDGRAPLPWIVLSPAKGTAPLRVRLDGSGSTDDVGVTRWGWTLGDGSRLEGEIVECEVVGLMEQVEDGEADHNVLARLPGSDAVVDDAVRRRLVDFVTNVFAHVPGKRLAVGAFLDASRAWAHVDGHRDR